MSIKLLIGAVLLVQGLPLMTDGARSRILTVSSVCLLDGEKYRNADYALSMVEQACARLANDLVVTPLMPFLSFREGKERSDLKSFADLAQKNNNFLAVAATEKGNNGGVYQTSVLFDRDGQIVGRYRKSHALPDDAVALGDELPVFNTDIGTIGFSIGTDFYFPEIYEVQSMKGADLLVWQHYPERLREHFQWVPLLKARGLDSHAHLITAMYADPRAYLTNRYDRGMPGAAWGRSMILNRVGTALADTGYDEGIATTIIDLDKRKTENSFKQRQTENIFYCNNYGDRQAFSPITKPWERPDMPHFKKRNARVAVGYFSDREMWGSNNYPEAMFRVIEQAQKLKPDILLLSEMSARKPTAMRVKVFEEVSRKAKEMNAYIIVGGIGVGTDKTSVAHIWDRQGNVVFKESIYWTGGFPEINIYDTDFARIGIHTCGDLYTGEIDRVLALKGAEIIFDPSQHWGADGFNNELLLRARAIDNGCWIACAHWNSSDPGLRSIIVDSYGYVMAASKFQQKGVLYVDIDFNKKKVFYAGHKKDQPKRSANDIAAYFTGDIPEQKAGWRNMIFSRRRPELYGIIPSVNEVIKRYRPTDKW